MLLCCVSSQAPPTPNPQPPIPLIPLSPYIEDRLPACSARSPLQPPTHPSEVPPLHQLFPTAGFDQGGESVGTMDKELTEELTEELAAIMRTTLRLTVQCGTAEPGPFAGVPRRFPPLPRRQAEDPQANQPGQPCKFTCVDLTPGPWPLPPEQCKRRVLPAHQPCLVIRKAHPFPLIHPSSTACPEESRGVQRKDTSQGQEEGPHLSNIPS